MTLRAIDIAEMSRSVKWCHQQGEARKLNKAVARVGRESAGILQVKNKLRALPEFKDSDDDDLSEEARLLITKDSIKDWFSHLYDVDDDVSEAQADQRAFPGGAIDAINPAEGATACARAKDRYDRMAQLPVRLLLSPLKDLSNVSVSVAKLTHPHGAMHAALIVGDVKISWDDSSLVRPKMVDPNTGLAATFQASIGEGEWEERVKTETPHMASAIGSTMDYNKQMHLVVDMATDKARLIDQLAEVIVTYNKFYYYGTLSRDCQGFIQEAMKALGILNPPKLQGKMKEYYDHLCHRKGMPSDFKTHAELDAFVSTELAALEIKEDIEYLMCLFYNFHKKAQKLHKGEQGDWVCESGNDCKMGAVVERLKAMESSVLDRCLPKIPSTVSDGATP